MDNKLRELQNLAEFNSNINLAELRDYDNSVGKKFGEFSFPCGCGQVHSVIKHKTITPTIWIEGGVFGYETAYPIVAEKNRILFHCKSGFFTMVSLTKSVFKNQIKTDFFVRREIIDAAENGFGLFISTKDYNLDFNSSRPDKVPTRQLTSWLDLEEGLLDSGHGSLQEMGRYNPSLASTYFSCPCGNKHNLEGQRGDYALNQPFGGFCVPVLVTSDGKRILSFCSEGYYCLIHARPTTPVEWYYKAETKTIEELSVPTLPQEVENSKLPKNIIAHIKYLHREAHPNFYGL